MKQVIYSVDGGIIETVNQILEQVHAKKCLLVCDNAFDFLPVSKEINGLSVPYVVFNGFTPNPTYEDVCTGAQLFRREQCDVVLAVGGGSALDVAKCIKLYHSMDAGENYLKQAVVPNDTEMIAVPTTAGTGSESTRYAVIYYQGEKQSVADDSILPRYVVLNARLLDTLPEYHRKTTMLDALCHGIESLWSVNSTQESRGYSEKAIRMILENMDEYLKNTTAGNHAMLLASNYGGQAINITQTTAGHAMCYKLTSLYGISHGHAAALCLPKIWNYMLGHMDQCIDPRGQDFVNARFKELSGILAGSRELSAGCEKFEEILSRLKLGAPAPASPEELEVLSGSVNPVRLKNNPVRLNKDVLKELYEEIIGSPDSH